MTGVGILQDVLVEKYIFLQKYKKDGWLSPRKKTEISIGDCNIFLHLCTPEKLKKKLNFCSKGQSYSYRGHFHFQAIHFLYYFFFFSSISGGKLNNKKKSEIFWNKGTISSP